MPPFLAHKKREKKIADLADLAQQADQKERDEREKACVAEIVAILEKHHVEIAPTLRYTPHGILPDVQFVAMPKEEPKPANDQPTKQPGAISDATLLEPATRNGAKEVAQVPSPAPQA